MAVATYTKSGTKASTPAKLDKKVFGIEVKNHELLKSAYLSYLAENRPNSARAKSRGEVRGGGAKPWRQKGTGRARFGSSRNPVWVGGGVAFGPTGNENYRLKMNSAAKQVALRQALSLAAHEGRIKVIENFVSTEGKTKPAAELLKKLGADKGWSVVVVDSKEPMQARSIANLPNAKLTSAAYLNIFDTVNADTLIITKTALAKLEERLGS